MKKIYDRFLLAVDLAATVFLGVEGALAAMDANLDLFGIMVLAFATALGGGVFRDLLIGAVPPASIRDPRYPMAAFAGGALAFLLNHWIVQAPAVLIVGLDAAGLALFAVAGAAKALDYEIKPFLAILMGTITGVGGGTIRDVFLARIPGILRADIYAVAALAGAAIMVIALRFGVPRAWAMAAGALSCFSFRVVAVNQHWSLPHKLQ